MICAVVLILITILAVISHNQNQKITGIVGKIRFIFPSQNLQSESQRQCKNGLSPKELQPFQKSLEMLSYGMCYLLVRCFPFHTVLTLLLVSWMALQLLHPAIVAVGLWGITHNYCLITCEKVFVPLGLQVSVLSHSRQLYLLISLVPCIRRVILLCGGSKSCFCTLPWLRQDPYRYHKPPFLSICRTVDLCS